jgi:hypothetical protein
MILLLFPPSQNSLIVCSVFNNKVYLCKQNVQFCLLHFSFRQDFSWIYVEKSLFSESDAFGQKSSFFYSLVLIYPLSLNLPKCVWSKLSYRQFLSWIVSSLHFYNIAHARCTFWSKKQSVRTHDVLENREYAYMLFQISIKNTVLISKGWST